MKQTLKYVSDITSEAKLKATRNLIHHKGTMMRQWVHIEDQHTHNSDILSQR